MCADLFIILILAFRFAGYLIQASLRDLALLLLGMSFSVTVPLTFLTLRSVPGKEELLVVRHFFLLDLFLSVFDSADVFVLSSDSSVIDVTRDVPRWPMFDLGDI